MPQILKSFSIRQIIITLIALALAFQRFVNYTDWGKAKVRDYVNRKHEQLAEKEQLQHTLSEGKQIMDQLQSNQQMVKKTLDQNKQIIDQLQTNQQIVDNALQELCEQITILIESDRDDIKAYITREHHYFCYQKGWIDDYSLECIEKRYEHYKKMKGNSFIDGFMKDIRELPKRPADHK